MSKITRATRLPRISGPRPDFVEIGLKHPHRMDGEALRCGRGGVLVPLSPNNRSCARPCPPVGAFGHRAPTGDDRGRSRPAHVDQLSGRCRPLRKSYAAELSRRSSDTYEFRPADRTDDYSAADFVISEALQQTDFDEIRHGVLSGWTAPLGIEPRSWIRGSR